MKKMIMMAAVAIITAMSAQAQTWTEVGTGSELNAAIADGAYIRLTADITLSAYLSIGNGVNQTVILDLNGHKLSRDIAEAYADGHVIEVHSQGILTVKDSSGDNSGTLSGGRANNGGGICNYGTLNFEGGTITNSLATQQGGGIKNNAGATVNMSGGIILGCWGKDGGGIFNAEGGTLNITDGTISGNTSNAGGGGIVNYGTATINKAIIKNNRATTRGGGIWNGGTLNLYGADLSFPYIAENTCGIDGGGIWQGGTLNVRRQLKVMNNNAVVAEGYEPMPNNLCLASGKIINVEDILVGSTEIHVYCENYESRVITSGYTTNGNKHYNWFKSDLVGMNNIKYSFYITDGEYEIRLSSTDGTNGQLIRYVYRTWDEQAGKVVQSQHLAIAKNIAETYNANLSGYYYVNAGVTTTAKLYASGEVHLILCDGASLTANCLLNDEHSIYIYGQIAGTGQFNATDPDSEYPGIGCHGQDGKGIFICGGVITVEGARECAGIGGGFHRGESNQVGTHQKFYHHCSKISIYGGTVNAKGKAGAAGIGGAFRSEACGSIYIYGGNVNATGGGDPWSIGTTDGLTAGGGAGIGGGDYCVYGGNIYIKGGNVIANGGSEAAGIGVGQDSYNSQFGNPNNIRVYISGGTVTANGGDRGAGIGGGDGVSGSRVDISGGTVRAYAGVEAAGIGSGEGADDTHGGQLTITGGFVEAWGKEDGAGIGSGEDAALGTVSITGGTLIAHGGDDSNAICTHDDNGTNDLEIGNQMRLRISENILPYNAREWYNIQTYHDIQIEPCTHSSVTYTVNGTDVNGTHTMHCSHCSYKSKPETHSFENSICTVCHVSGSTNTVSIYLPEEVDESYIDGHYTSTPITQTLVTGTTFELPAPPDSYLPTGFVFAGWRIGTPDELGITSYCVGENEQVLQSGASYTVNADVCLTARYKGINGIATNLNQVTRNKSQVSNEGWYMMDGRKLSGKPTAKGIYMNNGHKVIIK